ncbi:hypothetical protein FB45DRAFT_1050898 [Roridomyces roridus]|uniref:Uncharacterized protein n=1 Tax=Roridomyces roridus TaxID=1738132 RepID=A0AAD7G1V5_9AGAR|nr:hypothetical protein FB45DRAFT_1050898 [Roridomyces roridus]
MSQHFPHSWLTEYPQDLAEADLAYFSPEADAEHVAIGPTVIRRYFGLKGAIIPIAGMESCMTPSMVFVLAGPTDPDGNKLFYAYLHDEDRVEDIKLCEMGLFASVDDFYQRIHRDGWVGRYVKPVGGGKEAAEKRHSIAIRMAFDDEQVVLSVVASW